MAAGTGKAIAVKLFDFAKKGELIVMVGAGVSAGKPSALPRWKPLNAVIFEVLRLRLESALSRPDWLLQMTTLVEDQRNANLFPPEYQAQLIDEMCGERYFRALQSLDVNMINSGHDGIAALAAAGTVRAVVTTNFDRLIERALEQHNVPYEVVYADDGFAKMHQRLHDGERTPLPVIKIHGCVSAHLSMIDTLKQRKRGRSRQLEDCLNELHSSYWLYLGFSAADLEGKPDYLGLLAGAERSPGATYVAYPGNPALGIGAQMLMGAFGDRGNVVVADVAAHLQTLCDELKVTGPQTIPADEALGLAQFHKQLQSWADTLSPAAAGLCLAAILEAVGQAEPAVRILDRLVRKELYNERDTADFRMLQLHYGRLGAAWGRFIAVPDISGAASNASVETVQSLLRVMDSELGFIAHGWLVVLWLWLNEGVRATQAADWVMKGFVYGQWDEYQPRTDEEAVDAWLSAVQVYILNMNERSLQLVVGTANAARDRAQRSGDVVRVARVAALYLLALAETSEDVVSIAEEYKADFDESARVGDIFAQAMRSLALGRWLAGSGRRNLETSVDPVPITQTDLSHLTQAHTWLNNQGIDPWAMLSLLQMTKVFADLHDFDQAQMCIDKAVTYLNRFPVMASHVSEVVGQVLAMQDNPHARDHFYDAALAAEESGLLYRREFLERYLMNYPR